MPENAVGFSFVAVVQCMDVMMPSVSSENSRLSFHSRDLFRNSPIAQFFFEIERFS
jgi:hypothetical protein